MNLGSLINPQKAFRAIPEALGAKFSPDQQNMLDDWSQGKFQKGDIALSRGVAGKMVDTATPRLHLNERMTGWWDRKMPNTFGSSEGDTTVLLDNNGQPLTGEALAQFYAQKGY